MQPTKMARADLTYRGSSSLQLNRISSHSTYCGTLKEAFQEHKKGHTFFITGKLGKAFDLVDIESEVSRCYPRTYSHPVRKVIHLQNTVENNTTKMRVTLLGTYAKDFDKLNVRNEYVTIVDPKVTKQRKFPFDDESDDNEYEVLVGFNNKLDSKICIHEDQMFSKRQQEKENLPPPVQRIATNAKQTSASNKPRKKYTILKECIVEQGKKNEYNCWAVMTKITRMPKPTRGKKLMATIYIEDPGSEGTFGFTDYQLSLLGDHFEDFPRLSVHSVVRVHYMKMEMYMGSPTGRVFSARSVTVIPGDVGDPIEPITTCDKKTFEFDIEDRQKVEELRKWWRIEQRKRGLTDLNGLSQTLTSTLSSWQTDLPLDLYCKILEVHPEAIIVTDGTECQVKLVTMDSGDAISPTRVTIFKNISPGSVDFKIPDVGDYVFIKGIQSVSAQNNGSFQLMCQFLLREVQVLPENHCEIKQIDDRLQSPPASQNDKITNNTLDALLAPMNSEEWDPNNVTTSTPKINVNVDITNTNTAYPTNNDELILVDSQSLVTASQTSEQTVVNVEEFFTCPTDQQQQKVGDDSSRLSPSPDKEMPVIGPTHNNYLWKTISELKDENINDDTGASQSTFRIKGYVHQISVKSKYWKQSLSMVCSICCEISEYSHRKINCPTCKTDRQIIFHFTLDIEEYSSTRDLPQNSPTLSLFVAGAHAERLLDASAKEYVASEEIRETVNEKLNSLMGKLVIFNVNRVRDSSDHHFGYQVTDSKFIL